MVNAVEEEVEHEEEGSIRQVVVDVEQEPMERVLEDLCAQYERFESVHRREGDRRERERDPRSRQSCQTGSRRHSD